MFQRTVVTPSPGLISARVPEMALRRVRSTFSLYQFSHTFLANQERHRSKLVGHLSNEKEKCRRPTTVVIFTVLFT
jgi:hypothetical protein